MRAELPAQVVELVGAFRNPITQIEFLYLAAAVSDKSFSPRRGVLSSDGTGTCGWK